MSAPGESYKQLSNEMLFLTWQACLKVAHGLSEEAGGQTYSEIDPK